MKSIDTLESVYDLSWVLGGKSSQDVTLEGIIKLEETLQTDPLEWASEQTVLIASGFFYKDYVRYNAAKNCINEGLDKLTKYHVGSSLTNSNTRYILASIMRAITHIKEFKIKVMEIQHKLSNLNNSTLLTLLK